ADDQAATVMYIGHNPAAAELVELLTGAGIEFPTSAIAVIGLSADWARLAPATGELIASWSPRPLAHGA
ncbi:MAG: histidine phosphatase family protein, partial [Actinobacteria bacterium]|nr:histidine phosphatase family protein [Actinomycetota bacterium]